MSYATRTQGFKTIALSEGYQATIRKLGKAAMDRCTAHLLKDARQHTEATPGEQAKVISDASVDNAAFTTELLLAGVVEWTLDGEDGMILPVDRQTVENVLTAQDAATLVTAISDLVAGPVPNSSTAGQNGSS